MKRLLSGLTVLLFHTAAAFGPMVADASPDLPKITVPTLLMRGAQSNVLAPEVAERAVATLPNGKLATIDPATHNVHSDNPNAFARELRLFLETAI